MIKNYLTIATRNLMKGKTYSVKLRADGGEDKSGDLAGVGRGDLRFAPHYVEFLQVKRFLRHSFRQREAVQNVENDLTAASRVDA